MLIKNEDGTVSVTYSKSSKYLLAIPTWALPAIPTLPNQDGPIGKLNSLLPTQQAINQSMLQYCFGQTTMPGKVCISIDM